MNMLRVQAMAMAKQFAAEAVGTVARSVRVKVDTSRSTRYLNNIQKEIRYVTAVALTRTTRRLVPLMEDEVRKVFDRPTSFSIRAFGTIPATKLNLASTLFIKDRQARYLLPQIAGGRRAQKPFEIRLGAESKADGYWAPGQGTRLNSAGNMTLRQIQDIANKLRQSGKYAEVFVGAPRGLRAPFGIWARTKGKGGMKGLKPLLIRIPTPSYKKRFDFHGVAKRNAQRIFDEEFSKAFEEMKRKL